MSGADVLVAGMVAQLTLGQAAHSRILPGNAGYVRSACIDSPERNSTPSPPLFWALGTRRLSVQAVAHQTRLFHAMADFASS